jgi:very-short-patch-repair endonuclease
MSKRLTTEQFITKSLSKHNNDYSYSKSVYIDEKTKVLIVCKSHGDFYQLPAVHYRSGCPSCGLIVRYNLRKNNQQEILNRFNDKYKNRFDYSKVEYVKMKLKVLITCNLHKFEFLQTPERHLISKTGGCPLCNSIGKGRLSTSSFIEKSILLYNNKYDYSEVDYLKSNKKVNIICKYHGVFSMTPNSHLNGRGCVKCNRNGGIMENIWLDRFNIHKDYRQYKIDKFYVDGVDLENNIVYEFNGDFWHGNPNIYNVDEVNRVNGVKFGELYEKTIKREDSLRKLGYEVISIWESDFKKETNIL